MDDRPILLQIVGTKRPRISTKTVRPMKPLTLPVTCQPPMFVAPCHILPTLAPIPPLIIHRSEDSPLELTLRTIAAPKLCQESVEKKDIVQKESLCKGNCKGNCGVGLS